MGNSEEGTRFANVVILWLDHRIHAFAVVMGCG